MLEWAIQASTSSPLHSQISDLELDLCTRADAAGAKTVVILKRLAVAREEELGALIRRRSVGHVRVGDPCRLQHAFFEVRVFRLHLLNLLDHRSKLRFGHLGKLKLEACRSLLNLLQIRG